MKELFDFYFDRYISNTAHLIVLVKMIENKEPREVLDNYVSEIKNEMEMYYER